MKNIREYKGIADWQKDLKDEGYLVPVTVCRGIARVMQLHKLSFLDAFVVLVEKGAIVPAALSKRSLDALLYSAKSGTKRDQIQAALDDLEESKGAIFGRKIRMDIKDDIHLFFGAMDYFYKTFPYGKDADIEFEEEMNRFDEFVSYTRKLTERIEQYESNNKPNRIIVHKYKFPDI